MSRFPFITHLMDIPKTLLESNEFILSNRGDYSWLCYAYNSPDMFLDPFELGILQAEKEERKFRLECRGLVFDKSGDIIRRPLHKFKNIGESKETRLESIDFTKPYWIEDKLDGSMISPFYVNGNIIWGTKRINENAHNQVSEYVSNNMDYISFTVKCLDLNLCPIYEFMTPENLIVIDHKQDEMRLLAVRALHSGEYLSKEEIDRLADGYNIARVGRWNHCSSPKNLIQMVKDMKGIEGIILCFEDGSKYKAKTQWYLDLHGTIDTSDREDKIINLIMSNGLDDLLPVLTDDRREKVLKINSSLSSALKNLYMKLDFAAEEAKDIPIEKLSSVMEKSLTRSALYIIKSNGNLQDWVNSIILKNSTGPKIWKEFKERELEWK